jgi:hypothetical protein
MPSTLPTSNVAGNNQTSPGTGAPPTAMPIFTPPQAGPGAPSPMGAGNPNTLITGLPPTMTGALPGSPTTTAPGTDPNNPLLDKQLVDIFGKGIGGSLDSTLSGMSGVDSAIFQQWQAGQVPVQQQERAAMHQQEGSAGVSANSSVAAIADTDLTGQFNAQAADVNAKLMEQNQQNTLGVLQGAEGAAAKEVASSGWDVFGQVMQGLGGLAGDVVGAAGGAGGFSSLFG